jgi:putative FmdB family regulatory protein
MPTYEYECTKCGHHFEMEQRITDEPRKRCPKCRGKVMRVVSGGGGYILKGSGFYATDYRGSDYKKAADKDKPKPAKKDKKKKKKK